MKREYNYAETPNSNLVSVILPCSHRQPLFIRIRGVLHMPVSVKAVNYRTINSYFSPESMPFVEPTTTRTCSHTFCRECIVRAVELAPQCPVDRSPLTLDDLLPANPIVRSVSNDPQFLL
jgi:hypothetical protein